MLTRHRLLPVPRSMTLHRMLRSPLPLVFWDVDLTGEGREADVAHIFNWPAARLRMRDGC